MWQAAPTVVVGRHTATYIHQGLTVDEAAFFVTSGADGISQVAGRIFQIQERQLGEKFPPYWGSTWVALRVNRSELLWSSQEAEQWSSTLHSNEWETENERTQQSL